MDFFGGGITVSLPSDVSPEQAFCLSTGKDFAEDNLMGVSGVGSMAKQFALGAVSLAASSY